MDVKGTNAHVAVPQMRDRAETVTRDRKEAADSHTERKEAERSDDARNEQRRAERRAEQRRVDLRV